MHGVARRYKALLAVAALALLYWVVFRRRQPKPGHLCNKLFAKIHKHIIPGAFDDREEMYVAIWASNSAHAKESCSFYSFHRSKPYLQMGYKTPSGEMSVEYVAFSTGEDGVISYFPRDDPSNILGFIYPVFFDDRAPTLGNVECTEINDPSNILGYIYPVFFDEFAPTLGNVECIEKNGFAEWKATLAVPMQLYKHPTTEHFIGRGIEAFQKIAAEIGVDIHLGRHYSAVCWKGPVWNMGSWKRKSA